jgi:3',5'-cyclic AMP phosphodiesterase CpdA
VALIGLSTGVPMPIFVAAGKLGAAQIERLDKTLATLAKEGVIRIILIHHPPHKSGATRLRELTDGASLRRVLAKRGCEAILHGHNHRASLASLAGPWGPIPVIGAPSASSRPSRQNGAGWWCIDIDENRSAERAVSAHLRRYSIEQKGFAEFGAGLSLVSAIGRSVASRPAPPKRH